MDIGKMFVFDAGLTIRCFVMRFLHLSVEQFDAVANPDNANVVTIQHGEQPDSMFSTGKWSVAGLRHERRGELAARAQSSVPQPHAPKAQLQLFAPRTRVAGHNGAIEGPEDVRLDELGLSPAFRASKARPRRNRDNFTTVPTVCCDAFRGLHHPGSKMQLV